MTITRGEFRPGAFGWAAPLCPLVFYPPQQPTLYLNDTDPQLRTVGTDMTTVIGFAPTPPNTGFTMSYTDAAGSTSTMTFDVTGENQFGEPVFETILIPTGAGTKRVQSVKAYRLITSIIVTATTGTDTADALDIGFWTGDDTNRLVIGLPVKLDDTSAMNACCEVGPIATIGTRRAVAGTNLTHHTFILTTGTGLTGGKQLQCRFKTDRYI